MKTLLTITVLFLLGEALFGQSNWLRQSGGSSQDEALDLTGDGEGNYYSTGYFNGQAGFAGASLTSNGYSDVFIQKFTENGEPQWSKGFGGIGPDRGTAISCDSEGNVLVTGIFTSQAAFDSFNVSGSVDSLEVFVAKLNSSGAVQWVVSCGGIYDDYSYGIDSDPNGNVLITGQFRGAAQFGPFTLTSQNYDDTNSPSYDIFFAKLSPDGEWLWANKGSSGDDNRGMDITADNYGNVYLTGQFSDTLTINNVYNNDVANAGFILKCNSDGEETWLCRLAANYTLLNDVECDDNNDIVLCGETEGSITVFANSMETLPVVHPFSSVVLKLSPNKELIWASTLGSESQLTAKALSVGAAGELYVVGTFRCTLTELSESYDTGIFHSMGYRDVYAFGLAADGSKQWERWFAGPYDDYCSGIEAGSETDAPVLAGSFQEYFHIPSLPSFLDFPENDLTSLGLPANYSLVDYCFDDYYGSLLSLESFGQSFGSRDIFYSRPVNLDRSVLDYYWRDGFSDCFLGALDPCIGYSSGGPNDCQDSLNFCEEGAAKLHSRTGFPGVFGPIITYQWNLGSTDEYEWDISQSQWLTCEVERADLCNTWIDSAYVVIHPYPQAPVISDNLELNIEAFPAEVVPIDICGSDTIVLWGGNICDGCNFGWSNGLVGDTAVSVIADGEYSFSLCTPAGCCSSNIIPIDFNEFVELADDSGSLAIYHNQLDVTGDSAWLCPSPDHLSFQVLGINANANIEDVSPLTNWIISFEGDTIIESTTQSFNWSNFHPPNVGWYVINAEPGYQWMNVCGSDTLMYSAVTDSVFVTLLEGIDVQVELDLSQSLICPGDTAILVLSGATNYSVGGPSVLQYLAADTLLVNQGGLYHVYGTSTSADGCTSGDNAYVALNVVQTPLAWMEPASGVVCPGDSVLLSVVPGSSYQWVGPLGELLDVSQSFWVTTPGFYYCIHESLTGCVLESNFVEVSEYSSPFLLAIPGTELCIDGAVTIQLETNAGSTIQWAPPLSGGSVQQIISEPGVYSVSVEGCGIFNMLSIEITLATVPASIVASEPILCGVDTITLVANPNMEGYSWQPGGETSNEISVSEPGTYQLITTDEMGCLGSTSIAILFQELAIPFTEDTTICLGAEAILVAEGAETIYWASDPLGEFPLSDSNVLVLSEVYSEVSVYAVAPDSICGNQSVEATVFIDLASIQPEISGQDSVCVGGYFELSVADLSGVEFEWTLPNGVLTEGWLIANDSAVTSGSGWYTVMAFSENCSSSPDSIFIDITNEPIQWVDIWPDSILCEGSNVSFSTDLPAGEYMWTLPSGQNVLGPQIDFENIQVEQSGTYQLSVTGAICTYFFAPVSLEVVPYPIIELNDSTVYCDYGYLVASLPEGYDAYYWSTGESGPEISIYDLGWLGVEVVNFPNCSVTDEYYIDDVDCISDFFNVISPNNDGQNEWIDFGMLHLPIEEVLIFNRWGNLIHRMSHKPFVWDGHLQGGKQVSDGTYYWVLNLSIPAPSGVETNGILTIISE